MKFITLADIGRGRDNNLNLIRMIAATGVLISHAWPVTTGDVKDQPLASLLGGIDLGMICVYIFFAISGYLIAQSYDRDPKLTHFWTARVLRIFPALLVVLLLTARSEEHTSELQSRENLVCRLLLEKKNQWMGG